MGAEFICFCAVACKDNWIIANKLVSALWAWWLTERGHVKSSSLRTSSRCTSSRCLCFFLKEEGLYFIVIIGWLAAKRSFLQWGIYNVRSHSVVNSDVVFGESMFSLWVDGRKVNVFLLDVHCLHGEGSHWLINVN